MLVSPALVFKKPLIVTRGHNSLSIRDIEPGERVVGSRRADSDTGRSAVDVTQDSEVPSDIDNCVFDAGVTQNFHELFEDRALCDTAKIQHHVW